MEEYITAIVYLVVNVFGLVERCLRIPIIIIFTMHLSPFWVARIIKEILFLIVHRRLSKMKITRLCYHWLNAWVSRQLHLNCLYFVSH